MDHHDQCALRTITAEALAIADRQRHCLVAALLASCIEELAQPESGTRD